MAEQIDPDTLLREQLGEHNPMWAALADCLDEWNYRMHGLMSGRHSIGLFLWLLEHHGEHGWRIVASARKDDEPKPIEYRDPDCWIDNDGRMQCNTCKDQILAFKDGGWACKCDSAMFEYVEAETTSSAPEAGADYGTALARKLDNGTVVVDHADPLIGITRDLLEQLNKDGLCQASGRIWLDSAHEYDYAFARNDASPRGFAHDILVYQRMHVAQCSSQGTYLCRGCACWCHQPATAEAVQ